MEYSTKPFATAAGLILSRVAFNLTRKDTRFALQRDLASPLSFSLFCFTLSREREREGDFIRALPLSYTANKFAYSKRGVRDIPRRSENEQQIEIYEKRENLWLRDFRLGGVNVRKERLEGPWHAVSC